MRTNLIEKVMNKLGYYKSSQIIQPPVIKQDIYKYKTLRTKQEFLPEEIVDVPTSLLIESTLRPLASQLSEICEITQTETNRGTYEIEATLRFLEREEKNDR